MSADSPGKRVNNKTPNTNGGEFEQLGLSTNEMMAKFKRMHGMPEEVPKGKAMPSARALPSRLKRDIQKGMVRKTNTAGLRSNSLFTAETSTDMLGGLDLDDHELKEPDEKPCAPFALKGSRPILQLKPTNLYQKDEHEIMEADEKDEMHTPFRVAGTRNGLRAHLLKKDTDKLSNHSSPC